MNPNKKDTWNPELYNRFQKERSAPFYDLMSLIKPGRITKAVDLGCGTGELTRILHTEFRIETMIGTDNSRAMLAQAEQKSAKGISFRLQDIEDF